MNKYKRKLLKEIKEFLKYKEKATARQVTEYLNNKEGLNINNGVTVLEIASLMRKTKGIERKKYNNKLNYYYIVGEIHE